MRFFLIILSIFTVAFSAYSQTLFQELEQDQTGIEFNNTVVDNDTANIFLYSAFYSGSGVAIGDINNDGLPDIYLGGNQVSDALYINKGEMQFEDITLPAGILNKGGWTAGVNMVDINQDGLMDIYVCKTLYDDYPELRKNELYINNGDLTFTESANEYGLGDIWRSQHSSFFDYDKDGDLDVYIVNQPPNPGFLSPLKPYDWRSPVLAGKLMQNNNGVFIDVTQEANVYDKGYPLSVVVSDYNNDGWPDFYVTNDYNSPDKLYINQKNGTFKNTIDESMGHISYFGMGCDIADINNDGLMDQVVVDMVAEDNYRIKANMSGMNPKAFWSTVESGGHYQYMLNTLQVNNGVDSDGVVRFSEISQLANVAYTDWSWSPLLADFDNDGNKDLIITNGLLRDIRNNDANKRAKIYLKPYVKLIDSYVADPKSLNIWEFISLDTLLSFYPIEPLTNYAFRNDGNYNFENTTETWGFSKKGFTVGSAYADLDLDGDLDIVFNNINAKASIYKNGIDQISDNNFVIIDLITPRGVSLYGTKIKIETKDKTIYNELSNARGFYSTSDNTQVIGLGENVKKVNIEITWSNGKTSSFNNIKTNRRFQIDYTTVVKTEIQTVNLDSKLVNKSSNFNSLTHSENNYDDYQKEVLLPHTMSDIGPKVGYSLNHDLLYMPGAFGFSGKLYKIENGNANLVFETPPAKEEVAALFVDLDNDNLEDLVVVTGGNEGQIEDELYESFVLLNKGEKFTLSNLKFNNISGQLILASDYDKDGDMDLLLGGRQIPGKYPKAASTYIYKNLFVEEGTLGFKDVTNKVCPELHEIGLVTDGIWQDIDDDNDIDLILVGEWMPVKVFRNIEGEYVDSSENMGISNTNGWWNTITPFDFDKDGDLDYVLGNLGTSYKYKATKEEPFKLFYNDYDVNGSNDIVLSYYNDGEEFPVRGRECSSQQVPSIKSNFKDYDSFASSNLYDIYGIKDLTNSYRLEAKMFESIVLENVDNQTYSIQNLPIETQFSSINAFELFDFDGNGYMDIVYGGNKYGSEIETPRADASVGGVLFNYGKMKFEFVPPSKSGLYFTNEIKDLKLIKVNKKAHILAFPNNSDVIDYTIISNE